MNQEVSNKEILEAIGVFAENVENRFQSTQTQLDKLTVAVVDLQAWKQETTQRFERIEDTVTRTFNRIDDFLHMTDRHEAEIAALRSAYSRHDDQISKLYKHLQLKWDES